MLGRSAWGVYWMARLLERAENTSRLLDAGLRMALTRGGRQAGDEWRSVLITLGQEDAYLARGGEFAAEAVSNWVLRGADNPASILAMIEGARTNARMVRTAITREVWEATNDSWARLGEALARPVRAGNLGAVLEAIRLQATLVRGAMEGTMLRNDIFNFARLGTHIERADNTARILDVKYHVLLPSPEWIGSHLDSSQWEMVLRSVAGERAFRWLNAGALDPSGIAEFLILDGRFPRSLAYCYSRITGNMAWLAHDYGIKTPAHGLLHQASARLAEITIAEIIAQGLHEFIEEFLADNLRLADAIAADYRFTA